MSNDNELEGSTVCITGGTGSFGSTMVRHLLKKNVAEIRVFSRDETKQDQMRNELRDEKLRFYIGDVRDRNSVSKAIKGSNFVFHAAALKQVPSCEFFPNEAVSTNILGSTNVLEASFEHEVRTVVCLSTDKAVYPINAMGMSKALMEKVANSFVRANMGSITKVAVTRYGNVMMSRGSVIPLFLSQIRNLKPITVTNPKMTRFMMSLSESVELVEYAFSKAESGDLFVKKSPGATVETLVKSLLEIEGVVGTPNINKIGIRHGEKQAEVLLSSEERAKAVDLGSFFKVPLDSRNLDYQAYFEKGDEDSGFSEPYTSSNTTQLGVEDLKKIFLQLPEFRVSDAKNGMIL